MTHDLHLGDCRDVMAGMQPASIDAIVTDPPYGLSFMGKGWDHGVPGAAFWTEALRVAKPGAHLLAFGGTRTVGVDLGSDYVDIARERISNATRQGSMFA